MTTYLEQLKSTLKTKIETSVATDAKDFNNQAAETFLTQLQNINTLEILQTALTKLNIELVDGYLYTHPLRVIISGFLAKITPEAIEVEKGSLETIATLTKQLNIAKAALETQRNLHEKKMDKLNHTVAKLCFSQPQNHDHFAQHRKNAEPKAQATCANHFKMGIFQP